MLELIGLIEPIKTSFLIGITEARSIATQYVLEHPRLQSSERGLIEVIANHTKRARYIKNNEDGWYVIVDENKKGWGI